MNNISFILFIFSLLIVSSVSADTDFSKPKGTSAPSDEEVRDAVVRALLDQENQTKKIVLEPLKEDAAPISPPPSRHQKKPDASSQILIKAKRKIQDKQRIKIQDIVAAANKQLKKQADSEKLSLLSTKTSSNYSKVIPITENKKREMTRLVVAEEDELKPPKKSTPKTLDSKQDSSPKISNNELTNKPNIEIGGIKNIPVGRNQLATEGERSLAEKNIIDALGIKQGLVSQLSRNITIAKPELQLNVAKNTEEGRNEPAIKRVQGWIYLGRFESGKWENKTLKVEKKLPQAGKQYAVKATSLYVRNALPKKGKMGKIIHAFRTDDKIKVLNLKGLGRNRDFYWAEILRE